MSDHTPCIRGCVTRRWHLPTCEWTSAVEAHKGLPGAPSAPECRGCRPRYATYGLVCESCHAHLVEWLSPASATFVDVEGRTMPVSGAAWVRRHLTAEIHAIRSVSARQDWERPAKGDDDTRIDRLLDVRQQLDDALYVAEERAIETFGLTQRLFDAEEAVGLLRTWLGSIERHPEFVVWLYGEGPSKDYPEGRMLTGAMVSAHMAAPWRPARRRVKGVPCPHCNAAALVIFGGSVDVTCTHCWAQIPRERYDQWTHAYAKEAGWH